MPIEEEKTRKKIRNAIDKFEIFTKAKECMKNGDRSESSDGFADVSNVSPLLIGRADLISAGIPQNWFLDPNYQAGNIEKEQFNLNKLS